MRFARLRALTQSFQTQFPSQVLRCRNEVRPTQGIDTLQEFQGQQALQA